MKASTLFLGFTLVALAMAGAGLWQAFGPRAPRPAAPSSVAVAPAQRPKPLQPNLAEPTEPGVRSVYPGGRPTAAARPASPESVPSPTARQTPAAIAPAPVEPAPAPEQPAAQSPAEQAAGDGIDLNSAPIEALNALGAGMIGKTIVANRPYASPEDLVTRRVLKRQDYETIKPRVVAR
ncbi:helix-hairpin-helix domain-containing protein [Methylobacterium brachythecii]|uniref:Cytoskeletal protein RodZ n=1 Tax=Methylobacterium brachythecii TaxID=1176177 RepID=A0A7W6ACS9_9HYPH|nr:helix-hairpin-helix domain-containing protein [Methylobacterium brachythecii]MBB3900865.1 cytoskeletal protein RodZ [Methylobacterium brachythecii]